MKLAINLVLSFVMLALSLWLIWPGEHSRWALETAFGRLTWHTFGPTLLGVIALLAVVHGCRSWRWHYLLAPVGVRLGLGRLLAVSSVGFMAILLVPARLGEFVRPALIRKKGHVSAAVALGTVAVERVVDGLIVSLIVFVCFFTLRGPGAPGWMMPTAYIAIAVFGVAAIGLGFALRWPSWTVTTALKLSLISLVFPRFASRIEGKLLDLIRGFAVLRDPRNLLAFLAWSLVYWTSNGVMTWLLARGMGIDLSLVGAFATMGLVAVGISLPNSPGLVGQFQYLTMLGVSLEIAGAATDGSPDYGTVLAYAIVIHGIQVIWYVGMGLLAIASPYVSFRELWASRKLDGDAAASDPPSGDATRDDRLFDGVRAVAGAQRSGSSVGKE